MKRSFRNNTRFAFELFLHPWLLHNAESYWPYVRAILNSEPVSLDSSNTEIYFTDESGDYYSDNEHTSSKKVAIIPLHSAMTKYDTCYSVGTLSIAEFLLSASEDDNIIGVVLDIDSPGGSSNSVMPLVNAIHNFKSTGKPIIAHCDMCASAALWVGSQCDAIYMDNVLSEIGSIGAYCSILDNRINKLTGEKFITIYADESTDKNKGFREALEGRYEAVKSELSILVEQFREAVKAGRPALDVKAEGVMTGAMFQADDAIRVGLADGVLSLGECVENVFVRTELNNN